MFPGALAAKTGDRAETGSRDFPRSRRRQFFKCGAAATQYFLESRVPVHGYASPTGGVLGHVPLSPNLAGIALHAKAFVHAGHAYRPSHSLRYEAHGNNERSPARATTSLGRRVAALAKATLRVS